MKEFCTNFAFGALTLALALAFVWACAIMSGCTVYHDTSTNGKATIITTDTTTVYHGGSVKFKNVR